MYTYGSTRLFFFLELCIRVYAVAVVVLNNPRQETGMFDYNLRAFVYTFVLLSLASASASVSLFFTFFLSKRFHCNVN